MERLIKQVDRREGARDTDPDFTLYPLDDTAHEDVTAFLKEHG